MWWKLFVDMTCHMASKTSVPSTHADGVEHFHLWSLQIDKILRIRVVFVDMTWQSHGHPQSTHTCGETPWTTRQIFIRFSLTLCLDDKYRKQLLRAVQYYFESILIPHCKWIENYLKVTCMKLWQYVCVFVCVCVCMCVWVHVCVCVCVCEGPLPTNQWTTCCFVFK